MHTSLSKAFTEVTGVDSTLKARVQDVGLKGPKQNTAFFQVQSWGLCHRVGTSQGTYRGRTWQSRPGGG